MIKNLGWRRVYRRDLEQRIEDAHEDLAGIAALLRNTVAEVWTESPSDTTKRDAAKVAGSYSLEGWRVHFRGEYQRLNALNTSHGARLAALDPEGKTAVDGLLVSLPNIGQVMATVLARYVSGGNLAQARVSQADRAEIAAVIEAELELS